jgi:hypothetical protein
MSAVYFFLWLGWTPAQIIKEFNVTNRLDAALAKLDAAAAMQRSEPQFGITSTRARGIDAQCIRIRWRSVAA